ncbi:bactofilin family protein [Marinibactrum halimedae]|uniref:Polymer-forming cytoskeletal protein n=1 Tax=Marinibactrum halimedae TaxID=1444977 RepID=A0AA37WMG9_9GAMM|nr:polymer-forming cytoskeletal protein [Marinibactrum halimedae]MCD9460569.1 polymer-forming cytoskeletal protein [Marinibactrum halimedae]GLS27199.1 hypothetical protein GCM10007877_29180 [Marinibactrum halimedae]
MANPLDPKPESAGDAKPFLSGMTDHSAKAQERPFAEKIEASIVKEHSVIGKNIKFRGELIGTEDLHIEGTVEGTVIMEGQNLSIGQEGEINANIHAQNIVINGKLTGDVLADEIIEIRNSAVVKGNLIAPRIQLDDGGKFRGSMDMVDSDEEMRERHTEFKEKLVHPHLPTSNNAMTDNKKMGFDAALAKSDAKKTADKTTPDNEKN